MLRNRTFFFASYEGMREKNARTRSDIVVPTAAERRGDFSQSPLTSPVVDPATGTPFPGTRDPRTGSTRSPYASPPRFCRCQTVLVIPTSTTG